MIQLTVEVEGQRQLSARLRRWPSVLRKHWRRAGSKSTKTLKRIAGRYPPAPPQSTYTRTGTLGRRWDERVGDFEAVVENPTPYGPDVMGDEDQAWMHRGRWRTESQVLKAGESEIAGFYEEALENAARELEGR